jgi:hypothetical protein
VVMRNPGHAHRSPATRLGTSPTHPGSHAGRSEGGVSPTRFTHSCGNQFCEVGRCSSRRSSVRTEPGGERWPRTAGRWANAAAGRAAGPAHRGGRRPNCRGVNWPLGRRPDDPNVSGRAYPTRSVIPS